MEMKTKDAQKTLEIEILNCKRRLKELASEIEEDEEKSKEYNKVIVQKAILVDAYKKMMYKPPLKTRIKKILSFKKRKKLICDYFLT